MGVQGVAIIYLSSEKFLSIWKKAAQARAIEMKTSSLMFLQRPTRKQGPFSAAV